MQYFNSRYNFCFRTEDSSVLYNCKTGATLTLDGQDSDTLLSLLVGDKKLFSSDAFDSDLLTSFLRNGFLVEENRNERLEIKSQYWKARGETPVVLTMTTTLDCNLGCYYCYENRTDNRLEFRDIDLVLHRLNELFSKSNKKSLHVDWYGGEPLMNLTFLEQASFAIQKFCQQLGIHYHASVISNGTVWPVDLERFVQEHRIRQVQISFDGLKENHNKRRRYLNKKDTNSFDVTFQLVERLLQLTHVDVRFNIDEKNKNDIDEFLQLIIGKGWFTKKYPAIFQPARISSYSERSSFLSRVQLSIDEFDTIRERVAKQLQNIGKIEESEVPDGFPFPKTHVCAALATDSMVVGADKLVYRCGLQVGEAKRAVGSLDSISGSNDGSFADLSWWDTFDPTELPSCSKCSFLPVCFGGCPKKHLESDQMSLDEQSDYWRLNLGKKVTSYLKLPSPAGTLTELDQFRTGY